MTKANHGLTPIEARALELVAEGLESGALAENFNMGFVRRDNGYVVFPNEPANCGTVCCIHGWKATLLNTAEHKDGYGADRNGTEYYRLCMGKWSKLGLRDSRPKKAARAIRHFLRTGKCPNPEQIGA